jgi:hypothetical protein
LSRHEPLPSMLIRLMPVFDPGKRWTTYQLKENAIRNGSLNLAPFIDNGVQYLRAEDGMGICSLMTSDEHQTTSVAFAFETGEIWSVDTTLLTYQKDLLVRRQNI